MSCPSMLNQSSQQLDACYSYLFAHCQSYTALGFLDLVSICHCPLSNNRTIPPIPSSLNA
uniref:Uncharacterized protein n=1 Tax=Aegilops tauschii subsp. strangulata TaxID=200361 RepID=A0A453QCC8_AEGTS